MLRRIPNFEPRKGPAVPSFIGAEAGRADLHAGQGGPTEAITGWLRQMGPVAADFTAEQPAAMEARPYRPSQLYRPAPPAFAGMDGVSGAADRQERRIAAVDARHPSRFLAEDAALAGSGRRPRRPRCSRSFWTFLRRNLNGQTSLPDLSGWASQAELLAGFPALAPGHGAARGGAGARSGLAGGQRADQGAVSAPTRRNSRPSFRITACARRRKGPSARLCGLRLCRPGSPRGSSP